VQNQAPIALDELAEGILVASGAGSNQLAFVNLVRTLLGKTLGLAHPRRV